MKEKTMTATTTAKAPDLEIELTSLTSVLREELPEYRAFLKKFPHSSLNAAMSLYKQYEEVKKKARASDKLDRLMDVLIDSSAHTEHLISLRNDVNIRLRSLQILKKKAISLICRDPLYFSLKGGAREDTKETALLPFSVIEEEMEGLRDNVVATLDGLDKVAFNLKTIISVLKSREERLDKYYPTRDRD